MTKLNICTSCGYTWEEFLNRGRLGCPDCYSVFNNELKSIFAIHHGRTKHAAPSPRKTSAIKKVKKSEELQQLKKLLKSAVKYEKFEEAIRIKREISRLEGSVENAE